MDSIARQLQHSFQGEVYFDAFTRAIYSTDASIYRIEPLGVLLPRHEEDLVAAVRIAAGERLPLLPRCAATSLAGQTVGKALVLDCSRYLDKILEINAEERWVRVQPGVVLDQLNAALRPHGLMFGPDVATSSRACVGGMIGNNSSGARSRVFGTTVDNLLEARVLLADGSVARFGPVDANEAVWRAHGTSLEARLYRDIPRIVHPLCEEIRNRYPRIQRRVSGYNLDLVARALDGERPLNLSHLVCGSEGTLGIVTEAKLAVVPRPPYQALGLIAFSDLNAALEASVALLDTEPVAIELVDRLILNLCKESREYRRDRLPVSGDPEALLLVEYYADTPAALAGKLHSLGDAVRRRFPQAECVGVEDPARQADIWKVRKAGLGLLLGMKSDRKPIAFVEDTAVAPERLPEYVCRFKEIVTRHETTAGYYGHASVGCLHLRPLIDIGNPDDVARMKAIASDVADLVQEFGGAMSGEHGDGRVRSLWLEKHFGPKLVEAFREVKRAFDPKGILNPGIITEAPPIDQNLRTHGHRPVVLRTHLSFRREGGMHRAVAQCSGVGICRKKDGVMCPSFMATGDERYSTRARANALRAVLTGELPAEELTSDALFDTLDLCLACKGCQTECPSTVDMARLKVEFLAQYYEQRRTPLKALVMGHIDVLSRVGSATAWIANPVLRSDLGRRLLRRFLGVDPRRTLPAFAAPTLLRRQKTRVRWGAPNLEEDAARQTPGVVALFVDTFVNHNTPEVGEAAIALLEALGYRVVIPRRPCCGRAALSQGLVERARALARQNVEQLWPYVRAGIPVVGLEPSCIATIRDEYADLLDDPRLPELNSGVLLLEEFLVREHQRGRLAGRFAPRTESVWFHGHCHQKALTGTTPALEALRLVPGLEVREIDSGCCGMAGAFGYDHRHYDVSMAVAEQRLFPAIRALPPDALIVAEGISCRQQIAHGTGRQAHHLAEVLRDSLA
ncbi:MAG: FAD-linked oxidase C-terminal domain-containing protein [Armatimonadota bacterium]|nr:FAD-linked oxidase C-terminal domain-containing protein [Armatimonadota bacterium]